MERDEAGSAKLVFVALTRIASERRSRTFTVPVNYIATLASVSGDTVSRRLLDLERLGLVQVMRPPGVRVQHTYTLTHPAVTAPCGNDTAQAPRVRAVLRKETKKQRTTLKSTLKSTPRAGAPEAIEGIECLSEREREVLRLYHYECPRSAGFLPVDKITGEVQRALATFAENEDGWLKAVFSYARSQPRTRMNRTLVRVLWPHY